MADETTKRRNLGRGLSALFGDDPEDQESGADRLRPSKMVPVEFLQPNRFQPRKRFDEDAMATLIESVREKGVLEPIVVRRHPDHPNAYEIVAGERRWRAAQAARQHEVPVVIKDLSDRDALEIAIVENIQREDLTPLEEAMGFRRLMDEFGHTQEALSKAVGKSRSYVANILRLLSLPDSVQAKLQDGTLTAGHARAVATAEDPEAMAEKIVKLGMTVREAEAMAQSARPTPADGRRKPGRPRGNPSAKDPNTHALERDLSEILGLRVLIEERGEDGGRLSIYYETLEQLDDVLQRMTRGTVKAADLG